MRTKTTLMNKVSWMAKNLGENLETIEYSNGDLCIRADIRSYTDKDGTDYGYMVSTMYPDDSELNDSHLSAYMSSRDSCERDHNEDDIEVGREYWDINVEFKARYDVSKHEWIVTDIIDDDYLDEYDDGEYEHMDMLLDIMNKRTSTRTQKLDELSKNIKDMYEWIYDKKWEEKVL